MIKAMFESRIWVREKVTMKMYEVGTIVKKIQKKLREFSLDSFIRLGIKS